jgi:uncharacterized RDD family membrane protein YckC
VEDNNFDSSQNLANPDVRLYAHLLNTLFSSGAIIATATTYYFLQDWIASGPKTKFIIVLIPIFILINYTIDAWSEGTTLGHKIMGLSIVDEKTKVPFSLGRMLLRELVIKGLVCSFISIFTLNIFFIIDSLFVTRDDRKSIHDRMAGSLVVKR